PDLDHLALGGSGRLCVIAAAWVRLFPAAPPAYAAWRAPDLASALRTVEGLCMDRLTPARGMLRLQERGALVALSWEGPESARLLRERAVRVVGPPLEVDAGPEVRAPASSRAIEVDARWSALEAFARHSGAAEVALYGMHAGGALRALARSIRRASLRSLHRLPALPDILRARERRARAAVRGASDRRAGGVGAGRVGRGGPEDDGGRACRAGRAGGGVPEDRA